MAQEVKYLSYSGLSHFKDRVFEVINPLISENKANILSIQNFLENPVFEEVNTNTLNVISEINLNGTRLFNFDFLPLSGGTITGLLAIKRSPSAIQFNNSSGTTLGYIGINANDDPVAYKADGTTMRHILHSSNYSSYALPLSGGAMTGPITFNLTDADRNVIRINNGTYTDSTVGQYGYTLKYLGSGSGDDNSLALYADNSTATTQNKAIEIKQSGNIHTRNIIPLANNTYYLGNSSYKWSNIYATTFTGNLTGNAATATKASTVTIAANSADVACELFFQSSGRVGTTGTITYDNDLRYNPSKNTLMMGGMTTSTASPTSANIVLDGTNKKLSLGESYIQYNSSTGCLEIIA